jgi:hypothetical protein
MQFLRLARVQQYEEGWAKQHDPKREELNEDRDDDDP